MRREGEDSRASRHAQHFLRSPHLCAQLVDAAEVASGDLVVDIGAGAGALTAPLCARARKVVAIEPDAHLAADLRRRFAKAANVEVREQDFLAMRLPTAPFTVVANLPFFRSADIFHHLLDNTLTCLRRADVVVEWGFAVKRAAAGRTNLLYARWFPWYEFILVRRLDARVFDPTPSVDAALISIRRRPTPLIDPAHAHAYQAFVERCYHDSSAPMKRLLRGTLSARRWTAFAHDYGLNSNARPTDLDGWQWSAVYLCGDRPSVMRAATTSQ